VIDIILSHVITGPSLQDCHHLPICETVLYALDACPGIVISMMESLSSGCCAFAKGGQLRGALLAGPLRFATL
jgi:hypothetical protein